MANYDSNYAIAQAISEKLGESPIPFDSVYSICEDIYHQLGGTETGFDSVYSILLAILPLAGGGTIEVERLLRLIELMGSVGVSLTTTSTNVFDVVIDGLGWGEESAHSVVWGDGTFTETDGENIISGDTANTTLSGGILSHTYVTTSEKKIKIVGTKFIGTLYGDYEPPIHNAVKNVKIDKGVTDIAGFMVYNRTIENITFDYDCTTKLGWSAFGYGDNANIGTLCLPQGVTFNGLFNSKYIFQDTVCNFVFPEHPSYTNIPFGFNYMTDGHGRYGIKKINIPEGITTIEKNAFGTKSPYYNGEVTKISLPSTLTTIGDFAFCYCFENNATIDLPSSVTSIGSMAFMRGFYYENDNQYRCKYTMISHAAIPPTAQSNSFDAVDYVKPTDCTLYVPNDSIPAYSVAEGWKDFGTILPIESMGFGVATNAEIEQMF